MAAGDLTSLADVKAWLKINGTDSDVILGDTISAVSGFIATETGRQLPMTVHVETVRGNGRDLVVVRQFPIISVDQIRSCGRDLPSGDVGEGTPGYYIKSDTGIGYIGGVFPVAPLMVVYTAGYAVIPADIAQVAMELVAEAYKHRRENIGVQSKSLGGSETVSFMRRAMNDFARRTLDQYRRVI